MRKVGKNELKFLLDVVDSSSLVGKALNDFFAVVEILQVEVKILALGLLDVVQSANDLLKSSNAPSFDVFKLLWFVSDIKLSE